MTIRILGALAFAACASVSTATIATAQSTYRLAAGDTLAFSVLQFPELTRNVGIGIDGEVFLPLIGGVNASGKTLEELRMNVEEILRREPVRLPDPGGSDIRRTIQFEEFVIDVAEYRPVYVTGAVSDPGEVVFRPGMTVRQAIARAGGIGAAEDVDEIRLLDFRTRRDDAAAQILARRDRVSRLRADLRQLLEGTALKAAGMEAPSDAAILAETAEMPEVGQAWLQARNALRDAERTQLETTLSDMFERLDVLEDLQRISEETVQVTEDELARVTDLRDRGIGTADSVNDAREDVLQASSRSLDTANELLRLKELITETENLLTSTEIESRVEIIDAIEEELFELARLEGRVTTLDRNMRLFGQVTEDTADEFLVRSFPGGGTEPRIVSPGEQLMPGDVIEILLQDPLSAEQSAGAL
ncbi:MAG: polysaccharide biosynthesis/export family protein [Pseudomonadota bacterium]